MGSFSGTSSLATDSMKGLGALLAKGPSAMASRTSPIRNTLWQPNQGIVFGKISQLSRPTSVRESSTIALIEQNRALTLHSEAEDSYVLASALEFTASNSTYSPSASPCNSDHDGSSWAPSSTSVDAGTLAIPGEDEASRETEEEQSVEVEDTTHTPLTFQIPEGILRKAKEATSGTMESFWSYKMYMGPDDKGVKVHYCKSKHTTERVAQYFLDEKIIGFDIEWKPGSSRNSGIKNNVALIQIASEKRIGLFHIAAFPKDTVDDLVAPTLKKIMEDSEVTKVGVAIKGDCTRLRNFLKIDPRGIFELSHLYKLVRYSSSRDFAQINKTLVSLSTQAEEHLELPIFKGEVRGSDWSQPLGMDQIVYAASDAYANFMLFDALESKRKQLKPVPPRPYNADLNLPIRLSSGAIIPATDEAVEDLEPETNDIVANSITPASAAEAAAQNIQIEEDSEPPPNASEIRPRTNPKARDSKITDASQPKSQAVVDAELWATNYRASNTTALLSKSSTMSATFSVLRVYAIWNHDPSFTIPEIAAMLRDPPLKTSTVAVYILDAVRLEKLPFEKDRLRSVLQMIPDSRTMRRYKSLWKMVE